MGGDPISKNTVVCGETTAQQLVDQRVKDTELAFIGHVKSKNLELLVEDDGSLSGSDVHMSHSAFLGFDGIAKIKNTDQYNSFGAGYFIQIEKSIVDGRRDLVEYFSHGPENSATYGAVRRHLINDEA